MKKKRLFNKFIARVLTFVMLVSLFTGVDMGWNVEEVKAATTYTISYVCNNNTASGFRPSTSDKYRVFMGTEEAKNAVAGDKITFVAPNNEDIAIYFNNTTKYDYVSRNNSKEYTIPSGKEVAYFTSNSSKSVNAIVMMLRDHVHSYVGRTCESGGTCACGATADPLGHSYGTPIYTWSADGQTCTATRTCANDSNHTITESATMSSEVKIAATCTAVGTTTYTANFTVSPFETQTNDVQDIPALGHDFSYSVSGNVITATCKNAGVSCSYNTNGITLALNADDKTYTGSSYTGASISNWSESAAGLATKPTTITYKNKEGTASYDSTTAPTNVGDYTASITVGGATATKDFKITKKNIADADLNITRDDAVYDGTSKPATVTSKDSVGGMGGITVKYQKKNGASWDEETADAPVNAGTYNVVAYIEGGDNFNESHVAVKEFTISKATPSITTNPTFNNTITYGSILSDITLGTDGVAKLGDNVVPGTFAWKTGTIKPVVSDSESANSTDFFIVFTPSDSENYNTCETNVKLTVNKAETSAPVDGIGYKLDYVVETLVADPDEDFEVSSMNGDDATPLSGNTVVPGNTYYVRYKETDNQNKSAWTEIHVANRPIAPTESVITERMDTSITVQMISGIEYSIDGTNWFTTTNAGSNVTVANNKITFGGLAADTNCTVYSRVKATNDEPTPHFHSDNTTQVIKTKKSLPGSLTTLFTYTAPTDLVYSKTPKLATVEKASGYSEIGELSVKYYDNSTGNEVDDPINVGAYTVKVSALATVDYPAVPETVVGTFTITKKPITITPNAGQSKSYGQADPVIAYTPSETLFAGDSFTGALTYTGAAVNAGVGTYSIVMGTLSAGDNYELSLASETVNFEITKATYTSGPAKNIGYTIDYVAETMVVTDAADFELSSTNTETATALTDNKVTPGNTYYIRYKENANQTASPWTSIILPARPAAPNAIGKQETVMNKKDAEVTGVNSTMEYKFVDASWTDVSGTSIPNTANKNVAVRVKASNINKNFYGQEKNIEFTASTTKLKVRLGDTIVEVPYEGTISADDKPSDPTPPEGQVFMYWAFGGEKWKFGDEPTPSKVTGNITLVPVFGVEIHGVITAQDYNSITEVSLVDGKGNSYLKNDLHKLDTESYYYSVIAPAGVDYNLVIEGTKLISGTSHNITKTQLANLKQGGNGEVTMPAGVFNSKVTKDTASGLGTFEHTLVGGLDDIADAHVQDGGNSSDKVTVELKVSANVDSDDKSSIETTITDKTLEFVELTLTKTTNGSSVNIGDANNQLLTIIIPYETAGKSNIAVYRYHGGAVDTLTTTANSDGEKIEIGTDTITLYAKKFSTYAIGYKTALPGGGSSGGSDDDDDDDDDNNAVSPLVSGIIGKIIPTPGVNAGTKQPSADKPKDTKTTADASKDKEADKIDKADKNPDAGNVVTGDAGNTGDNEQNLITKRGWNTNCHMHWWYFLLIVVYVLIQLFVTRKNFVLSNVALGIDALIAIIMCIIGHCYWDYVATVVEIILAVVMLIFTTNKKSGKTVKQ